MSPHEEQQPLTIGEFSRSQRSLERMIASGFGRVDARFDEQVEAHRELAERVAKVEAAQAKGKTKTAGWSAAIATALLTVFEALRHLLAKG